MRTGASLTACSRLILEETQKKNPEMPVILMAFPGSDINVPLLILSC